MSLNCQTVDSGVDPTGQSTVVNDATALAQGSRDPGEGFGGRPTVEELVLAPIGVVRQVRAGHVVRHRRRLYKGELRTKRSSTDPAALCWRRHPPQRSSTLKTLAKSSHSFSSLLSSNCSRTSQRRPGLRLTRVLLHIPACQSNDLGRDSTHRLSIGADPGDVSGRLCL